MRRSLPPIAEDRKLLQHQASAEAWEAATWELGLQLVQTAAVVVGVVFGLIQLRHIREQREIQAGVELLRPLQSPEMAETILQIYNLPENLSGQELRSALADDFGRVLALLGMFESLGPLVARGHVPIDMYEEFYRGPTVVCWDKLHRYVEEQRKSGWLTLYEWTQWLAERMQDRSSRKPDVPAYERFRSWADCRDFEKLAG